jgi:hypothetical protein
LGGDEPIGKEDAVRNGDRIRIESERAGQSGRTGTVREILSSDPKRLRVEWDDGHTSVIAPAAGAIQVERRSRKRSA